MKTLYLSLKKQWYDQIASGKKTEEYRDITPYYTNKLYGQKYDAVRFYCNDESMTYKIKSISIASKAKKYVIHLGERIN